MNYHKKGLKRLLNMILADEVGRLVITHKDRLLRFGAFAICKAKQVEVVILNQGEDTSFKEDLAKEKLPWRHPNADRSQDRARSERQAGDLLCQVRRCCPVCLQLREPLRFNGKILSATISRVADLGRNE